MQQEIRSVMLDVYLLTTCIQKCVLCCTALFRWVYEKTRLPVVPLYGGFPVKLRTLVGDPIMPDVTMTPDELTVKVKRAIEQLISNNQRLPGSIVMSLIDRFRRMPEAKTTRTWYRVDFFSRCCKKNSSQLSLLHHCIRNKFTYVFVVSMLLLIPIFVSYSDVTVLCLPSVFVRYIMWNYYYLIHCSRVKLSQLCVVMLDVGVL